MVKGCPSLDCIPRKRCPEEATRCQEPAGNHLGKRANQKEKGDAERGTGWQFEALVAQSLGERRLPWQAGDKPWL